MEEEWISVMEAAKMLRMQWRSVSPFARKKGLKRERRWDVEGHPFFYLRQEIVGWAEFLKTRDGYRKRHRAVPGTPRIEQMTEKEARASGFYSVAEAAQVLQISGNRVRSLIQTGKLVGYQALPGRKGSKLFVSRSTTNYLATDEARLARKRKWEAARKSLYTAREIGSEIVKRQGHAALPPGLLTSAEAAALLGIAQQNLSTLRKKGRLQGVHQWVGRKKFNRPEGKRWYFWEDDVRDLMAREGHLLMRSRYLKQARNRPHLTSRTVQITPGPQWERGGEERRNQKGA